MTATPARKCERCGSRRLGSVSVAVGYWRKECRDCGSTGPFPLAPLFRAVSAAADRPDVLCRCGHTRSCHDARGVCEVEVRDYGELDCVCPGFTPATVSGGAAEQGGVRGGKQR